MKAASKGSRPDSVALGPGETPDPWTEAAGSSWRVPDRPQAEAPSTAPHQRSKMTHRPGAFTPWTVRLQAADPSASLAASEAWPIGMKLSGGREDFGREGVPAVPHPARSDDVGDVAGHQG
jgi:hypothetical protein